MTQTASRRFTFIELITGLAVLVGLIVFFDCAGLILPIEIIGTFLAGWAFYLWRVVPQIKVDWSAVGLAVTCLALFTGGLHAFLQWIYVETRDIELTPRWSPRWTFSIVACIVLMFVAGIAATGVAHQTGWLLNSRGLLVSEPQVVRRMISVNNLKQVGLAVFYYQEAHHAYPPGGTIDQRGQMRHGWQSLILPYLEQNALYERIDFAVPWDDPRNAPAFQTIIGHYSNPYPGVPKRDAAGYALSYYTGNAYVLGGAHPRTPEEITDGTSNTILAGEVAEGSKPWGHPANWRDPALGINRSPNGFGSFSPGGANVLFADGMVKFVKSTVDPKILKALGTPAGGEKISGDQF